MSNIVALGFPNEAAADAFMSKLDDMGSQEIVTLTDLVKVTVNENGEPKLHHKASPTTGGAVVGGFLGGMVGLIFLNPIAGAAIGAAGGAAVGAATGDYGIDDDFIKQTSDALKPGTAALFMQVEASVPDQVQAEIEGTQATVISTTLSEESETRLRDALS